MSHDDCIAVLLGFRTGRPSGASRREAEEHAARCSDCWTVLRLLHELAAGTPAPEAERMRGLFGCEAVQDELYLLSALSADEIRTGHPAAARHLGWCHACRERWVEVLAVEAFVGTVNSMRERARPVGRPRSVRGCTRGAGSRA